VHDNKNYNPLTECVIFNNQHPQCKHTTVLIISLSDAFEINLVSNYIHC